MEEVKLSSYANDMILYAENPEDAIPKLLYWIHGSVLVVLVWRLQDFLHIVSCHLHMMTILLLPCQFEYIVFLFIVWLWWLGLPTLCWKEVVRRGILFLFQISAGRISAFYHWVSYWPWVWQIAFIMFRCIPSIFTFVRAFVMNGCWILLSASSASLERIVWFLSFLLLMWCVALRAWSYHREACVHVCMYLCVCIGLPKL